MKKITNHFIILLCLFFMLNAQNTNAQCIGSFNYSLNSNGNVTFTSTSVTTSTSTNYLWQFGNSTSFTAMGTPTAAVTYTANGTYTVVLSFTTIPTCPNTNTSAIITVTNVAAPGCSLNANFSYIQGSNGLVNFNSTSTNTIAATTYSWNYGDASTGGTGPAPAHTYTANGTYNVTLYANNNFTPTCIDSVTIPVVVNSICNISPNYTYTNGPNGLVNFTSTSTGTISGTVFLWNYGDSASGMGNPIAHTYTANGMYIATLTVVNNSATCFSSYTQAINISNISNCNLNANFSYTQSANGAVGFTSTSTGTVAGTTYIWNFGDASSASGITTTHTYSVNGLYTVTLTANNNFSITCTDTETMVINVTSIPCNITANYNHLVLSGGNVIFTNASGGTNSSTTYLWNFGDGFTSTSQSPSHIYSSAGAYIVRLLATNNASCQDSIAQAINVTGINCIANAGFNLVPTATAQVWNAAPVAPYNVIAASWNWGDNTTSNTLYTSHTYSAQGYYSICLSVTVSCGGTATACVSQFINKASNADMQMVQVNIVPPALIQVGLEDQQLNILNWSVYPNPSNDAFEIKMDGTTNETVKIKIYDLIGETVYETETTNDNISKHIGLENISNGVYFIKLNANNKEYTKKVIVNK